MSIFEADTTKDKAMNKEQTPIALRVGGRYNWVNQLERLAYMGTQRYRGDPREWHQFEKVDTPGAVWCEVLGSDLDSFEETNSSTE